MLLLEGSGKSLGVRRIKRKKNMTWNLGLPPGSTGCLTQSLEKLPTLRSYYPYMPYMPVFYRNMFKLHRDALQLPVMVAFGM